MKREASDLSKVISKIHKLLAMAEDSSSPNEALIAARRARNLMDKYQLSKADIEKEVGSQFLETQADLTTGRRRVWVVNLWSAAADLNDCVAVIVRSSKVEYRFQGFKSDALVAKLTMDYLVEVCTRLCEASNARGISEKNFFKVGFSEEIMKRASLIAEERRESFVDSTGTALVPVKESMIEAHFGKLKPMETINQREPSEGEVMAMLDGIRQARSVSLDKQVDGDETTKLEAGTVES